MHLTSTRFHAIKVLWRKLSTNKSATHTTTHHCNVYRRVAITSVNSSKQMTLFVRCVSLSFSCIHFNYCRQSISLSPSNWLSSRIWMHLKNMELSTMLHVSGLLTSTTLTLTVEKEDIHSIYSYDRHPVIFFFLLTSCVYCFCLHVAHEIHFSRANHATPSHLHASWSSSASKHLLRLVKKIETPDRIAW